MSPSLPLDPVIAALANAYPAPASPFDWAVIAAAGGVARDHFYACLASSQAMADQRALAGYLARRGAGKFLRRGGYQLGVIAKRPRESAGDRRERKLHERNAKWTNRRPWQEAS